LSNRPSRWGGKGSLKRRKIKNRSVRIKVTKNNRPAAEGLSWGKDSRGKRLRRRENGFLQRGDLYKRRDVRKSFTESTDRRKAVLGVRSRRLEGGLKGELRAGRSGFSAKLRPEKGTLWWAFRY